MESFFNIFFNNILIIFKYSIYTLIIFLILNYFFRKDFRLIILQPVFVIFIPIISYFILPNCSIAYVVFLTGQLIGSFWGINRYDRIMDLSAFQRKYGHMLTFIANILSVLGVCWGIYNIIFA